MAGCRVQCGRVQGAVGQGAGCSRAGCRVQSGRVQGAVGQGAGCSRQGAVGWVQGAVGQGAVGLVLARPGVVS